MMKTAAIQTMPLELIMDGQMIRQNFKQKHLSENWLMNELVRRGIYDISEVSYACLGTDQKLYIDTKKDTNTEAFNITN
ncbi:DUF421 domain-containing protein [Paenibacillus sp. BR2-3]|uniref:YetF domain-containing protein n=1 Tax=Paenibacillus sp. BR2-3 TaxID=3048494 RepID=UPI003977A66F